MNYKSSGFRLSGLNPEQGRAGQRARTERNALPSACCSSSWLPVAPFMGHCMRASNRRHKEAVANLMPPSPNGRHQGTPGILVIPACLMLQESLQPMQTYSMFMQELASKDRGGCALAPQEGGARAPGTRAAR